MVTQRAPNPFLGRPGASHTLHMGSNSNLPSHKKSWDK